MTEEINQKKSLNPIADRVEKRTKEISIKSEKIVNDGLDILKDFIFKLLEVRPREYKPREYKPREYKPREFRQKDSGDEKWSSPTISFKFSLKVYF